MILSFGCSKEALPSNEGKAVYQEGPVTVGFLLGNQSSTRSEINGTADGFLWQPSDRISVWAKNSSGTYVLQNQVFSIYARKFDAKEAYFTSTLGSAMTAGTYTYYIAYPVPASVSGTKATFNLSDEQDGKASSGTDISISSAVKSKELTSVDEPDPIGQETDALEASLHHILHFLRFYIPKGCDLMGESVKKIVFSMPQVIAGTITVDITDPTTATLTDGSKEITLDLTDGLSESKTEKTYAVAGIFPPASTYSSSDFMQVTLYSDNKVATVEPVSLMDRNFPAGHVTAVPLVASKVSSYYTATFTLESNHLGEEVQKVTLALPDGTSWPGTTSSTFTYSKTDGSTIAIGDKIKFATTVESEYRAMSGKSVTVTYESEDAIVSETILMADLSSGSQTNASLNVPYLFSEDFSSLSADFHSNDEYSSTFVTGSKEGIEFMPGWSGGRVGGQAGTAIRITARREVSARYAARCDSPFMTGLKHTAAEFTALGKDITLKVTFNYSMGREEGILIYGEVSQTMYFGKTSTTGTIKSGDETGTFDSGIEINETTGSFTNINHDADYSISGMGSDLRLSWRTYTSYYAFGNSSCYLYLDNINVSIEN